MNTEQTRRKINSVEDIESITWKCHNCDVSRKYKSCNATYAFDTLGDRIIHDVRYHYDVVEHDSLPVNISVDIMKGIDPEIDVELTVDTT